jgi:single-strand DNA-binding protein
MASLNKVILIGNLTRDPEVRYTPKGAAVCDVSIAVNRKWRDEATGESKEEVTFVDITVWGKQAENVGQYLRKGSSACFEGRLQQESWEDKQTGQKRNKLKVVAESVQFIGSKREGGDAPRQQQQSAPPRQQQPARRTAADAMDDAMSGNQDMDGDDIPF